MGSHLSVDTPPRTHGLLAGVTFLTRVPIRAAIEERDIAASVAWFAVVGALIGAAAGLVYAGASELWPAAIAAIVAIGASIAITGGALMARWAVRSLGSVSGDVLGAIEQMGEIVTLLTAAAAVHAGWVFPF